MSNKPWKERTPEEKAAHYERRRRWAQTEKGRKTLNQSNKRYRKTHPEFVESQKEYHALYYKMNRKILLKESRDRYYRRRRTILSQQRDYRNRRKREQFYEEQAISRYMERIEADATMTSTPDPVRLGYSPITKRADKRVRGVTHKDTVALRLAARKGEPLPIQDNPVRIGVDRNDPSYKGVRYHNHLLHSGQRSRNPITPGEVQPRKPAGGVRIEHGGHKKVKEAKRQAAKLRREE